LYSKSETENSSHCNFLTKEIFKWEAKSELLAQQSNGLPSPSIKVYLKQRNPLTHGKNLYRMVFKVESSLGKGLVVFIVHHIKENVTFLFPAVDIMQNTHGHECTSHLIKLLPVAQRTYNIICPPCNWQYTDEIYST
jgi:hypothetical protein